MGFANSFGGGGADTTDPNRKKPSLWEGFKRFPSDLAQLFSAVTPWNLPKTAASLWPDIKHFGDPLPGKAAEVTALRNKPLSGSSLGEGSQILQDQYGTRLLPLVSTFGLLNKQGRAAATEHPFNVAVDVGSILAPGVGSAADAATDAAAVAAKVAEAARVAEATGVGSAEAAAQATAAAARAAKVAQAARVASAVTHAVGGQPYKAFGEIHPSLAPFGTPLRTALRAAEQSEKIGGAVRSVTLPVRGALTTIHSVLPTRRLGTVGPLLATATRQIQREISERTGPLADIAAALTAEERSALGSALYQGRPPAEPHLRAAYDAYSARQEVLRAEKLTRELPKDVQDFLREKALAKTAEVMRRVNPQTADRTMEAFRNGEENPFPNDPKAWTTLKNTYQSSLDAQLKRWRVKSHPDPRYGGEVLSQEQFGKAIKALRDLEAGRITQAAYDKIVERNVPARHRPALEEYQRAVAGLAEKLKWQGGYGRRAFNAERAALEQSLAHSWMDLADQGLAPEVVDRIGEINAELDHLDEQAAAVDRLAVHGHGETPGLTAEQSRRLTEAPKRIAQRRKALHDEARWLGATPREEAGGVYVHRQAYGRYDPAPTVHGVGRLATGQPGSLKTGSRLGERYTSDPFVGYARDETQLVTQHVSAKVVAQTWREGGGTSWTTEMDRLRTAGWSEEDAARLIRQQFRTVHLNTFQDAKGTQITSKAAPGELLVPRDVANALDHYLAPKQVAGWWKKGLKVWTIPVLYLAPAFHMYNILGGALLTAFNNDPRLLLSPRRLGREIVQSIHMMRNDTLDVRIPTPSINKPAYRKLVTPKQAEQEGARLASLTKRILGTPAKLLEYSRRLNDMMDGMYRSITYLDTLDRNLGKGMDRAAAEEGAIKAASHVLQNWDTLSPFERGVLTRIIPFWSWKRTMIGFAMRYPAEHPYRLAVLHALTIPEVARQQAQGLPDDFRNYWQIPGFLERMLPGTRAPGSHLYLNMRGADPFADVSDLMRLRGWTQALHPAITAPAEVFGFDPSIGGFPAGGSRVGTEIVPGTDRLRQKLDWGALAGAVPQLRGALQAIGTVPGLPPPKDLTQGGFLQWARRYWSTLRLPFSPSERNVEQVRQQYLQMQAAQAAQEARAKAKQQQPVTATTPGTVQRHF